MYCYVTQKQVMKDGSRPLMVQECADQDTAYMTLHQIMASAYANVNVDRCDVIVQDEYFNKLKQDTFDRTPAPEPEPEPEPDEEEESSR
jgi:hypothetical protein